MKTSPLSPQRKQVVIHAVVDGTGTAHIDMGNDYLTLTDNGTGDYSLAIADDYAAVSDNVIAHASPLSDTVGDIASIKATGTDKDNINVLCADDTGAAKDMKFMITIVLFMTTDNDV